MTGRPSDAEARLSKARAIFERLAADHPESPEIASELGATLHNLGELQFDAKHFTEARDLLQTAMVWQRKALASSPGNPRIGSASTPIWRFCWKRPRRLGDQETVKSAQLEKASVAASDPRKVALDERLASIAKGEKPRDDAERLALAQRAVEMTHFATAARLWAEAFANDPQVADNRQAQYRYNASCAALLAAAGQSKDNPPADDAARDKFRAQALEWLKAELFTWKSVSATVEPAKKETVAKNLVHWKDDTDLATIRDEKELAKLSANERSEWQSFWADVDALLKQAQRETR